MRLFEAAKLFAFRILWQWFGLRMFGERLIRALGSDDENVQTLAGMFLVQTGKRSKPLLEDALAEGQQLPMLLTILGDMEDTNISPEMEKYTQDPNPDVARAAHDAIKVIKLRQQKARPQLE